MAKQSFDCVLPDDEMREQLKRGETFSFSFGSKWQEIEQQIERLGFGDDYFVSQIKARRGKMTKVTPVPAKTESVRDAA
jgi:hypothetical protein